MAPPRPRPPRPLNSGWTMRPVWWWDPAIASGGSAVRTLPTPMANAVKTKSAGSVGPTQWLAKEGTCVVHCDGYACRPESQHLRRATTTMRESDSSRSTWGTGIAWTWPCARTPATAGYSARRNWTPSPPSYRHVKPTTTGSNGAWPETRPVKVSRPSALDLALALGVPFRHPHLDLALALALGVRHPRRRWVVRHPTNMRQCLIEHMYIT